MRRGRVWVDVVWNQESAADSINLASSTALRSMCIYAYKGAYSHTRKSDSKSDMSIWAMPQPRQPGIVVMKEVFCVF